ncbi:restriction endonuclease subunit S [Helicobacter winghamensis]|uniref:restriction endonuclease subunit S n=1 Tax=Helicobacter winghamensis TaxID=157268 RepID=UPI0027A5E5BF
MIVNLKEQHCENFLQSLHKEQWQEVRLGEITSIIGDGLHGTPNFDVNGECFFINGNNLNDGQIIIKKDTKKVSSIECAKYKKDINEKTILISINGTLGNMALYRGENIMLGKSACYLNFKDNASRNFMRYVIINSDFQRYLNISATGTTILNVPLKAIRDFTFLLPPLTIQQKIAEILSSFDDKIDLLHRQNKTLESLALTLFRHYFIDNPKRDEWEEKPLSEIAEIGIGRTPPRKERHWFSTDSRDIKWISIKDMEEKIFIVNTSEFLTMEAIRKFRIPLIPPNTILLSFKMTLGRVSITTENMLSNEAIAHFNLYSEYRLFTEYLYCFLKTFKYETLGSTSSIVTAINSTLIKSINIRIPDRKIIVEFSMIAKGFFDKIYNNTKQIQNLQAMRDMMLGKIFN